MIPLKPYRQEMAVYNPVSESNNGKFHHASEAKIGNNNPLVA
jgi:hypothetical protein